MSQSETTWTPEKHERFNSLYLVDSPRAMRILAWILGVSALVGLFALVVTPWQQTVLGSGRVVAFAPFDRVQILAAPVSGRVRKAWVQEGSKVEAGDRILEIIDNDPSILERLELQREAIESQLRSARERVELFDRQIAALNESRTLALTAADRQVDVASADVRSAQHGLDGARATASQAELNFKRQKELVAEGLVSGFDFEMAERVYREAQAKTQQARQTLEAARAAAAARESDQGRVGTDLTAGLESARTGRESASLQVSSLNERLASLDTRIARQNTQLIKAPRAGTVFRMFAAPGAELVKAGDPLISLIPDTESRAVELWVNGNDVPLIEKGRKVRLQFEGWPAVQFSGWPSVAVGTFGGEVVLVDQSDDGRGQFRILISPDPEDQSWPEGRILRQGVRTKGFVLLDQVSLGFELWRQANGFPPSIRSKTEASGESK